ncbi:hypothetical protein TPHA_0B01590 [Tetrapisispora phaffii CBS 4417]|uniref:3-hydroxy-3-methylglutaryl coenzyme A reductase n=1 Tax=Tetrapisispora phaffii (strain ATCC 24235 / CBS 4417 / NBRC 1672 / NRRL Y-8282 / UCD 70-5) TaxID=1071381 RepID=G8BPA1_TETPH|nr:hypothetical protein TPHA_0B01590 [Tetrapisispora phaffii CBS 4417]CCE61832.1 hypothetical protein TPHA_0B01590 [Tetrapisispora phaffii CBS 4417]
MIIKFKEMYLSFPGLIKIIGSASRTAAEYPIQLIITVLLISMYAYLSTIELLFEDWSSELKGYIMSMDNLKSADTNNYDDWNSKKYENFIKYKGTSSWINIDDQYSKTFGNIYNNDNFHHYYLFNVVIDDEEIETLSLTNLWPNVIQENSTLYILSENNSLNLNDIIGISNNTGWELIDPTPKLNFLELLLQRYNHQNFELKNILTNGTGFLIMAYFQIFYLIINLFLQMKNNGSNFWLGFMALVSSACSIILALFLNWHINGIKTTLTELFTGLPFILVIVGFKHKIMIAKDITKTISLINIIDRKEISKIISDSIINNGTYFLQEYLVSIISFIICSFLCKELKFAKHVCILSACVLSCGLLLTVTFYCAILSLKLELNIIHRDTALNISSWENTNERLNEDPDRGLRNFALKSPKIIRIAKVLLISIIILVNVFELLLIFVRNTKSQIKSSSNIEIPGRKIQDILQLFNQDSKNIVLSVSASYFFHIAKQVHKESWMDFMLIEIYKFISYAIRDKLISKLMLCLLAISCSSNIYLLNVANIHTAQTRKTIHNQRKEAKKEKKHHSVTKLEKIEDVDNKLETPELKCKGLVGDTLAIKKIYSDSHNYLEKNNLKDFQKQDIQKQVTLNKNESSKRQPAISSDDQQVIDEVINGKIPLYSLETYLNDKERAVYIRRKSIAKMANIPILDTELLPYRQYNYERVFGACCENVIGYMPIPVGLIGPLIIDGTVYHIPMATTEGCLVASAMRGCKAVNEGGGLTTVITKDGMSRGPCVQFPSLKRSSECKMWLDSEIGLEKMKVAFNSTSRFARLQNIKTALAGDLLYIRFVTTTGDAMGMNMISNGVEHCLSKMKEEYNWNDLEVISISGNYCTDKKAAAINWIEGRGKSVVAEAIVPGETVRKILKTDVKRLVEVNISKNLIGSAMAGAIGGYNAHAANLVTAVFIAMGQDPAQNVESSNCITLMSEVNGDLKVSVSMPSIEVGTIGGGTVLDAQGAMLDLVGVRGPHLTEPGANARKLASVVASAVLVGELSLISALSSGHLVKSHMALNRSKKV